MRNSIMAVTMFTVACGYIGARALPEILLNPDWVATLNTVQAGLPRRCKFFTCLHVSIITRLKHSLTPIRLALHKHAASASNTTGSQGAALAYLQFLEGLCHICEAICSALRACAVFCRNMIQSQGAAEECPCCSLP